MEVVCFGWPGLVRAKIGTTGGRYPFAGMPSNKSIAWEYKGRQIVDRGFILVGPSSSLHDLMKGHNRPYVLKTETQTEPVSLFSNQDCDAVFVFVGDLQDCQETLRRVYGFHRARSDFGTVT